MERGSGCHVWDVDGNEYLEYGMGLRAVTLGHGYPAVAEAVAAQVTRGTNFVRPSRLEVEAAEAFLGLVTRAEMVKFTKDGSTANTGAVKLARAFTGRDLVALCVDHPFFSYDDWAMVATPVRGGIPADVAEQTLPFHYDDLASVEALLEQHPGQIACFVLEPERTTPPSEGFLRGLQELLRADGALLVFDENVTGFRWDNGGAQQVHGITPDLSTWGRASRTDSRSRRSRGGGRSCGSVGSTTTGSACSSSRRPTGRNTSGWRRGSPRWRRTATSR